MARPSAARALPMNPRANSSKPISMDSSSHALYRIYIAFYRGIILNSPSFNMRYIPPSRRCRNYIEQINGPSRSAGTHATATIRQISMGCRVGVARAFPRDPSRFLYITWLSVRTYHVGIQCFRAITIRCVSFAERYRPDIATLSARHQRQYHCDSGQSVSPLLATTKCATDDFRI